MVCCCWLPLRSWGNVLGQRLRFCFTWKVEYHVGAFVDLFTISSLIKMSIMISPINLVSVCCGNVNVKVSVVIVSGFLNRYRSACYIRIGINWEVWQSLAFLSSFSLYQLWKHISSGEKMLRPVPGEMERLAELSCERTAGSMDAWGLDCVDVLQS